MKLTDDRYVSMRGRGTLLGAHHIHEEMEAWLRQEEDSCREERIERLKFILDAQGHPVSEWTAHSGGFLTLRAYEEARLAYLNGLYLATVLVVQSWLEKTLASVGRSCGKDVENWGLARLLDYAVDQRILTRAESEKFHDLRNLRNPYAHGRAPLDPRSLEVRAIEGRTLPMNILREDAEFVLWLMLDFKRRRPHFV